MEFPSDNVDLLPPGWRPFPSRPNDIPFDCRMILCEQYAEVFGVGQENKELLDRAVRSILANLVLLADDQWCFYSRDHNYYANHRRYMPRFYSYSWMVRAIEVLKQAGLVEDQVTLPSPQAKYRSRLRPTAKFRKIAANVSTSAVHFALAEVVLLKDPDHKLIKYQDTASIRSMRADINEQNAFLSDFDIGLSPSCGFFDDQGFMMVQGRRISPHRSIAYRVFNCDWNSGGRWYGPWWQNLPSGLRPSILIDSQATVEEDISCCHPRLLFAAAGTDLVKGDFYSQFNQPRNEMKRAFNTMLNASSRRAAVGAIEADLRLSMVGPLVHRPPPWCACWRKSRCWPLSGICGFGLQLQNVDAAICTWILRRLRRAAIPCLSIHDSFIVPQGCRDSLLVVMQEGFDRALKYLFANGLSEKSRKIF